MYIVSGPRHSISVGSGPVVQCVPVMGDLWVACDGTIHMLQKDRKSVKVKSHCLFTECVPSSTSLSSLSVMLTIAQGNLGV